MLSHKKGNATIFFPSSFWFCCWIRDPRSGTDKNQDSGSEINIPDPQQCSKRTSSYTGQELFSPHLPSDQSYNTHCLVKISCTLAFFFSGWPNVPRYESGFNFSEKLRYRFKGLEISIWQKHLVSSHRAKIDRKDLYFYSVCDYFMTSCLWGMM